MDLEAARAVGRLRHCRLADRPREGVGPCRAQPAPAPLAAAFADGFDCPVRAVARGGDGAVSGGGVEAWEGAAAVLGWSVGGSLA